MKNIIVCIIIINEVLAQCIGDLNLDDNIDVLDVVLVSNIILDDSEFNQIADLNTDNILDILDVIILVNYILEDNNLCDIIWGEEMNVLPEFYFSSDIQNNQMERVFDFYNIAKIAWGNYGPLEFWVIGTDISQAQFLDQQYCELRLEKDICLDDDYLDWCLNREYSFVDYANYGGAGLSLSRNDWYPNCNEYSYMEITLSSQYPFPDESDYDVVTMHEYFHAYQQAHIYTYDYNERAELMVENPWWSEGGAEYMAQLLYAEQPLIYNNYLKDRMTWKMQSKNYLLNNELISEIPYGPRGYIAYDLGAWAIAYLISIVGIDEYRVGFYNDLNEYGWEESFYRNFNMNSNDFLIDFHNFLNLNINEQLNIIP